MVLNEIDGRVKINQYANEVDKRIIYVVLCNVLCRKRSDIFHLRYCLWATPDYIGPEISGTDSVIECCRMSLR